MKEKIEAASLQANRDSHKFALGSGLLLYFHNKIVIKNVSMLVISLVLMIPFNCVRGGLVILVKNN